MSNKAPANWKEKTLGEVCIVQRGSSPRPIKNFLTVEDDGVNWIRIGDCFGKYVTSTSQKITKEGAKKSRQVQKGDFIISNSMSYGKPYILKIDGYIHDGWFVLKLDKNLINTDFFYYLLSSNYIKEQYDKLATGAIVQNISSDLIKKVQFLLPPLSEQERIVRILDEVFENIEKAKQNTLQNLNNAKELFESFANMILFKNNDFYTTTIGDSCNLATGGTPDTKNQEYYQNGNIKWLVSGDIHQAEIFDCQGRITEKGLNNSNAKYLPINSVLIALNGQGKTRGTVAILRTKATCNQSLVSINPKNSKFLSTEYLYQNLRARYIEIRKMTGDSGNDRRGLNMGLIRSIQINVPKTLNEQLIIAKKLSNLQLLLKQLEQTYNQKLKSLEELKQSILQKAFNGEL